MKLSTKDLMQKLANIYIIQGSMLSYDHINGNYIILIQEFGQGLVRGKTLMGESLSERIENGGNLEKDR